MSGVSGAVEVALGRRPAGLVLAGGTRVHVSTGELLEGWGAATAGDRIVYGGPAAAGLAGPDTRVVPVRGRYPASEFIDGQMCGGHEDARRALGCRAERPLLVLTFTAIPALRIREQGLLDVKTWRLLGLGGEPAC